MEGYYISLLFASTLEKVTLFSFPPGSSTFTLLIVGAARFAFRSSNSYLWWVALCIFGGKSRSLYEN